MNILRWMFFNAIMLGCLIAGFEFAIEGAENVGLVMVWLCIVVSAILFSDDAVKEFQKKPKSVPLSVDRFYDFIVFLVLAWYGWIITAVFYLFHMAMITYAHEKKFDH